MAKSQYLKLIQLLEEQKRRAKYNKLKDYFPDKGNLRRSKYKKHLKFFEAGNKFQERALIAGNRCGKTLCAMYECTLHATGLYPDWWKGKRFYTAVDIWVATPTNETTRDILQNYLFGSYAEKGTGLLPKDLIIDTANRPGIAGAIGIGYIRHKSGATSTIGFKSYVQGRESFQGVSRHLVFFDEEPPLELYNEALMRTMDVGGHVISTFTPIKGITEVVQLFLPRGKIPENNIYKNRFVMNLTWDDAPHLSTEEKKRLQASIPHHELIARRRGLPFIGSGKIYRVSEEEAFITPIEIPSFYLQAYGMDVGWQRTAVIWGALDPQSDIIYVTHEYYRSEAEPIIHAEAIKARGAWMRGAVDPNSHAGSQKDGRNLFDTYVELGLDLINANNAVEYGIHQVSMRLKTGRLKIFNTCLNTLGEYRIYRRKDGKIVKKNDHLMDALRYLVCEIENIAGLQNENHSDEDFLELDYLEGKSQIGGY